MNCFSCNAVITKKISYCYNNKKIGLIAFFPKLEIGFCPSCDIPQVNHATLQKDKLNAYYSYVYRAKAKLGVDSGSEYDKSYFSARAKAQAKLVKKYFKKNHAHHIFEFGAGYGYTLSAVKEFFPHAEIYSNECDQTIKSICEIKDFNPSIYYDIIIMSHVLEHLEYPQNYLENMINCLSHGGILFIEIPIETQYLSDLNNPVEPHITFFNLHTLKDFIKKHFNSQLEIIYAGTAGLTRIANPSKKEAVVRRAIKVLSYKSICLYKWLTNAGEDFHHIDFSNNTTREIWNNARIICRKK